MTKSRPLKSAMVRGRRVRPHTKRRNSDRSVLLNSSITSQNHCIRDADASTPLYVATDLSRFSGMSGLPHICITHIHTPMAITHGSRDISRGTESGDQGTCRVKVRK